MYLKYRSIEELVDQNKEELLSNEELLSQIELRLEKRFSQTTNKTEENE